MRPNCDCAGNRERCGRKDCINADPVLCEPEPHEVSLRQHDELAADVYVAGSELVHEILLMGRATEFTPPISPEAMKFLQPWLDRVLDAERAWLNRPSKRSWRERLRILVKG